MDETRETFPLEVRQTKAKCPVGETVVAKTWSGGKFRSFPAKVAASGERGIRCT